MSFIQRLFSNGFGDRTTAEVFEVFGDFLGLFEVFFGDFLPVFFGEFLSTKCNSELRTLFGRPSR
jgi:hypothetical protein